MASESTDPALSPAVIRFVIAGKLETWKLRVTGTVGKVDPIHSTGAGAVEKK